MSVFAPLSVKANKGALQRQGRARRREPWDRFALRALLVLTLLLGSGAYLCDRFRIGIDDQAALCLPPYRWYLIDTHARAIAQGELLAFAATEAMAPYFTPGQTVIKRAAGVAGDRIQVTAITTLVNGVPQPQSALALAKTLGERPAAFSREGFIVPDDQLWVMGETRDSFDSRYWGALPMERVIGRAYALF
ncbi:signal peptidase I [Thiohalocapsa marina]|uniref:signal peptidase I n=1 Tax=Thiohalocapsa marina TaxID=424902 RepID=UPI0036DEC0DB